MRSRTLRGISSDGTDIDHSITELNKGAPSYCKWASQSEGFCWDPLPFYRNIQIRDIMQDEIHKRLIPFFSNALNKGLWLELLPNLRRSVHSQQIRNRICQWLQRGTELRGKEIWLGCRSGPRVPSTANRSEIFARSKPSMNPIATFLHNSDKSPNIAGDARYATTD